MEAASDLLTSMKNKVSNSTPYSTQKFLSGSKEFLQSNTLIAKATFIMLLLVIFCILYLLISKLIIFFLSPSETPYLLDGMKDATQQQIITQALINKNSIQILRSKDQYEGVEFTYSFWIHVNNLLYHENQDFQHVFHKGSSKSGEGGNGIYGPNNSPGVYLYSGKKNLSDHLKDKYPVLGMLVRLNVYQNSEDTERPFKYYEDIYIDGIPIKKWVGVVIRLTSQNIVDVYINGNLTKRHKLSNVVKQNYDNVYINLNGGFSGFMSNLKYYNYAIGTFEIDSITSKGPNLKMADESNIEKSKPYYLSNQWYFNETDVLN